ncbi:MAG: ADP-forming succinate--CoA ligase subunit beta [Methylococcaceae bacterium]
MHLHEYQAKQLLAEHGIPIPSGLPARSGAEARTAALQLGGTAWVIKAQAHTGGRGKAGGVIKVDDLDAVSSVTQAMLSSRLITAQTGEAGLPVDAVLVEALTPYTRELYLSVLLDRSQARMVFMASQAGGMDIEEIAAHHPERILTLAVDPLHGLQAYQCREIGFALALSAQAVTRLTGLMLTLYRLMGDLDCHQIEINPLVLTADDQLMALDVKLEADDSALYAHPQLSAWRDIRQENEREARARELGLSYVSLGGQIGCMVNGAGLAMATLDVITLHGGHPANFLDVGGGATAEKVAEAFKLILSDDGVQVVLVNIFGGIVRCDLIAAGLVAAFREVGVAVPVVVRLEGTNAAAGRQFLNESGLALITADDLDDAATKAVAAVHV